MNTKIAIDTYPNYVNGEVPNPEGSISVGLLRGKHEETDYVFGISATGHSCALGKEPGIFLVFFADPAVSRQCSPLTLAPIFLQDSS